MYYYMYTFSHLTHTHTHIFIITHHSLYAGVHARMHVARCTDVNTVLSLRAIRQTALDAARSSPPLVKLSNRQALFVYEIYLKCLALLVNPSVPIEIAR